MYHKRKISIMLIIILVLQIVLPIVNAVWENKLTSISNAVDIEVYNINTAQDLWDLAAEVNNGNSYKGVIINLTADIDLGCSEEKQWISIGNKSTKFSGIFNGKNHTISGLYINSDKDYQGLFGDNEGTIKNFTIEGQVSSSGYYIGGVVGINHGSITSVTNKVIVTGMFHAGGICGANQGKIYLCQNNATIGGEYIGGITSRNSGEIDSCSNNGKINGNHYASGIVLKNTDTIKNCYNSGKVIAIYASGLVNKNEKIGIIENCYTVGELQALKSKSIIEENERKNKKMLLFRYNL